MLVYSTFFYVYFVMKELLKGQRIDHYYLVKMSCAIVHLIYKSTIQLNGII